MPKVASGQPLRSVDRLLDVLASFSVERPACTNSEISQRLELAPSTVRRLLLALEAHGLVEQPLDNGQFRLTTAFDQLATIAWIGELVPAAKPYVDEAHEATGETVILAVLDGDEGVHVYARRGVHFVSAYNPVGYRVTPYAGGAIGKVLLAWRSESEVRSLLPPSGSWTPRTARAIGDTESFMHALAAVRRRGYAVNNAETDEDVWAVAAPAFGRRGRSVAAVHIAAPRTRANRDRRTLLTDAVLAAAQKVTEALR